MVWGLLLLLFALFLAAGAAGSRKVRGGSASDLIVAGRSMPVWLGMLTMTATWVDGGYLLGSAEGAYKSSVASGLQGGLWYGVSLILGGILFAAVMRRHGFTTLIDPFEARYGKRWAAVLVLPALAGETIWSAELLAAMGSGFGAILDMPATSAMVLAAAVVTLYTMWGGMWAVAYTDVLQLALMAVGLGVALPVLAGAAGGLEGVWSAYAAARPDGAVLAPPLAASGAWTAASIVSWWDVSIMLAAGGIPWNCYFQRVLSCRSERDARAMSICSGLLTIAFVVPPLIAGMAAATYRWPERAAGMLAAQPSLALPLLLREAAPAWVAMLGLVAIVAAAASSFSSSILSAASMFSWNCCQRLLWPKLSPERLALLVRASVGLLGAAALLMALEARSVQALWFFSSDLVFVLLFPQLVCAVFDSKANRAGSAAAFAVSLVLRLGGGEPLLGLKSWYGERAGVLPFRTAAALAGLILLPVVSRWTALRDQPRPLANPAVRESTV